MKVAQSAFSNLDRQVQNAPILSLLDEEVDEEDKTKLRSFKLYTDPDNENSPKFLLNITVLDENASVRAAIKWRTAISKILAGLNVTDGAAKHPIIQELASGAPLQAYNTGTQAHRAKRHLQLLDDAAAAEGAQQQNETDEAFAARIQAARDAVQMPAINNTDVEIGLNSVMVEKCPYKALEKQKRFMRRKMRKPANLTTRAYVSNLIRINGEELPMLPPFGPNQGLSVDEIIDIVTYGIPKSWVRKMDEHDFDPLAKGVDQLVAFCERMEAAEEHRNDPETKGTTSAKKASKKHKSTRNNGKKWCDYHETNSHNTSECEVLKKLKASKGDSKPPFKNKTWKRKSDDAKSFTKKELNAIARKAGAAAIKKAQRKSAECNAINAKRKSDSDESDSEESTDSNNSLNMIEKSLTEVDKQLAEFDFDANKSDGEISV